MTNENLVNNLIKEKYLETPVIIEAFRKIDRKDFVLEEQRKYAYINQAMPIGEEQTISQPLTVAFMLEKLKPKSGDKILEIGAGSGWQASLLSYIINKNDKKKTGQVITIERIEKITEMAKRNAKKYNFIKRDIIKIIQGNGVKGYEKESPYDKIIVSASGEKVLKSWKDQLKIGGRIVAPIKSSIYVLDKLSHKEFDKKQYFGFNFVPLIDKNE